MGVSCFGVAMERRGGSCAGVIRGGRRCGGLVGLGLMLLGLAFERAILREDYARLVSLNVDAVLTTVVVAFVTVIAAAVYPAWQTSRLALAWQLKSE